jgi:hypothetical protein
MENMPDFRRFVLTTCNCYGASTNLYLLYCMVIYFHMFNICFISLMLCLYYCVHQIRTIAYWLHGYHHFNVYNNDIIVVVNIILQWLFICLIKCYLCIMCRKSGFWTICIIRTNKWKCAKKPTDVFGIQCNYTWLGTIWINIYRYELATSA